MSTPILLCPKCGGKTWDGPRYVSAFRGVWDVCMDKWNIDPSPDYLSYTCTDCRFGRYETPLDRRTTIADLDLGKGQNIWLDKE